MTKVEQPESGLMISNGNGNANGSKTTVKINASTAVKQIVALISALSHSTKVRSQLTIRSSLMLSIMLEEDLNVQNQIHPWMGLQKIKLEILQAKVNHISASLVSDPTRELFTGAISVKVG